MAGLDPIDLVIATFEGLNTVALPEHKPGGMRPSQAVLLENLETSTGELRTIRGQKRLKSARVDGSRPILGTWRVYKGSNGQRKTIYHTRNKFWTLSGSSVASITGSAVTITSGNAYTVCSYQDVMYASNGTNPWVQWTFSAKLTAPTSPGENFRYIFPFEEKIVHARGATNKDKVLWSDEGAPTTFQSLNFIFYPPDRSDDLTLAWPLNGEVILATTQRIGKTVGGLPPKAVIDIDLGKGCVSHYSAAVLNGWLYFMGLSDVYRTDGNVVQRVSRDVDLSDVTISDDQKLRGSARDGRYYDLAYRSLANGAGFPDRVLTYDAWKDEWHGPHKFRVGAWYEWRTPKDDGRVVGGDASGFANLFWSGSAFAGTKITSIWQGAVFSEPSITFRKAFEEMEVQGAVITSGSATLALFLDRKATASNIGTVSLKSPGAVEGDRDDTSQAKNYLYMPKKVNFLRTARQYKPQLTIAQKSGRARISTLRIQVRQLRTR